MIKFENTQVFGWKSAIHGMRNSWDSWTNSDSKFHEDCNDLLTSQCKHVNDKCFIGNNDMNLMMKLVKLGSDHRKFLRMINVSVDITAPLYWWKEFDTYKVGTVSNSCSTMHTIMDKELSLKDFSCEHLTCRSIDILETTISVLNRYRDLYLNGGRDFISDSDDKDYNPKDKEVWWQVIQLLPSSYNQTRTIQLNYEVLINIYNSRRNHKLDEWRDFCYWITTGLPYSCFITG